MKLRCLQVTQLLFLGLFACAAPVWGETLSSLPVDSQIAVSAEVVGEGQQALLPAPSLGDVSPEEVPAELQVPVRDDTTVAEEEAAGRAADNQFATPETEVQADVVPRQEALESSPSTADEPPINTMSEPSLYRLAVVGVRNETNEREFSKLLIAQGVSQLVAQALFDTGRYAPVEDNPEITSRINELVALAASNSDESFDYSGINAQSLGCDAMASVAIKKFSKSRIRGFAGPFSAANVDIEIELEVAVKEEGKPLRVASGSGTGTTKSRGVLFQVREDKVHFDQTSVGQATEVAVQQAVSRLLAQRGEGG